MPAGTASVANDLALRILDAWCEVQDPGAVVIGDVVEVCANRVAWAEFDGGVSGSAHAPSAYRLGDTIVMVGDEVGAYAMHKTIEDAVSEWLLIGGIDIRCPVLKLNAVAGLRVDLTEIVYDIPYEVRINGTWWTVHEDGTLRRSAGR
jgi:hypothetical protein